MTAFLDCLNQLQSAMLERPGQTGFALPYRMEKGKIEDPTNNKSYSIRCAVSFFSIFDIFSVYTIHKLN